MNGFSPRIYFQRLDHQRHRLRRHRAVQTDEASGLGMHCHYVEVDRELEDVGLRISLAHIYISLRDLSGLFVLARYNVFCIYTSYVV
jgi:hypothetical protein